MRTSTSYPERYTLDELVEAERRHADGDGSWTELAEAMGKDTGKGSGERLRHAVKRRVRKRGSSGRAAQGAGTVGEGAKEPGPSSLQEEPLPTLEEQVAETRARMLAENEASIKKQLLQQAATTQALVETLERIVPALPLIARKLPTIIVRPDRKPEEVIAQVSDCQIGQWTRQEETGGLGHYDLGEFAKKAERWRAGILSITEIHRKSGTLPRLHVWFTGDIVDGEQIFPNHAAHIDTDLIGQIFAGVDTFAPILISFLDYYPKIRVVSVSGNHGRLGKSKHEPGSRYRVNADFVLAHFLKERLRNYDRIEWDIPESWFTIQEVQGWRFLLHHYDVIKSWNSLPYYSMDRYDRNFSRLLQSRGLSYQYMVGGHHHNPAIVDTPVGEWIISGAWPGASYYSLRDLAVASRASQWMFAVHRDHGLTWRYKVDLDEERGGPLAASA